MAQSITTTIFITVFATNSLASAIVNQIQPTPTPSLSTLPQNPGISVIFVTTTPASSLQSATSPTKTFHSDTRSRLTSTSSNTSKQTTLQPRPTSTTLPSPNNTISDTTSSKNSGVPEPSQPKPTLMLGHSKKHTIIIAVALGVAGILVLTVLCTALYIWHRRRKKARQARTDQEKAQAYSYSYNTIPIQIPHSQEPTTASLSLRPVGTLIPRKFLLALAPASGSESGFATSTPLRMRLETIPSVSGGLSWLDPMSLLRQSMVWIVIIDWNILYFPS